MKRVTLTVLILLWSALLASACGSVDAAPQDKAPAGAYKVDAFFWDFYVAHGGEKVFGPAITSIFTFQGKKMQYLENGLMVYGPHGGEIRYHFASLGLELNLVQQSTPVEDDEGGLYIGPYFVPADFLPLYEQLGAAITGPPISNPTPNYSYNRIEQHFQNLGLYYRLDDPDKEVRLLEYGLAVCGSSCRMPPDLESAVANLPVIKGYFVIEMENLSAEVTGNPVTTPFTAQDGRQEVIFENLVMFAEGTNVNRRALPELVGYPPAAPINQIPDSRLIFIPINGELGHNVLLLFHEWITHNGGYTVTGMPTTEVFAVNPETGLIRQCFSFMCLDYYPASEDQSVRPAALGYEYQSRYYPQTQTGVSPQSNNPSPGQARGIPQSIYQLQVWARKSFIQSTQPQTIYATLLLNGSPVPGLTPTLSFSVDDGPSQAIPFPATNQNGQTEIALAPIAAANGSLVSYEVCISLPDGGSQCAQDSFLIWANP